MFFRFQYPFSLRQTQMIWTRYSSTISIFKQIKLSQMAWPAVFIMILNDHYLKFQYPGFVTGKLSDLVGPFILFRLLLGFKHLKIGLDAKNAGICTLLIAISIKLFQPIADFVTRFSCSLVFSHCHLIADPWDIFAYLPFAMMWFMEIRRSEYIL